MLLISNDPLVPRQRLAEPSKPPAPGPTYLADADHLVVGRGHIAAVENGWLELTGVEPLENKDRFWLWDDAETILAYHPDGRSRETPERPNQRRFRERLLREYGGRCAVTGCDAPEMLDAAHLTPWRIADEGILLRTDVHRMIDRGRAEIRNGRFRLLHPTAGYEQFDGVKLRKPHRRRRVSG